MKILAIFLLVLQPIINMIFLIYVVIKIKHFKKNSLNIFFLGMIFAGSLIFVLRNEFLKGFINEIFK